MTKLLLSTAVRGFIEARKLPTASK